jgi:hypothetical protein
MKLISSEEISEDLIELLEKTELGTNGARYVHLDTRNRIKEADHPISYSLVRNQNIIANITFCRRDVGYYLRYFAFSSAFQNKSAKKVKKKSTPSPFENKIEEAFVALTRLQPSLPMYAYIDYENDRSRLFSERFGFAPYTDIVSRTYSRSNPKKNPKVQFSQDWNALRVHVEAEYSNNEFYHTFHIHKGPYVVLKNQEGQITSFAKFTKVHWKIKRLPGRFGGLFVKVIPYIPILNKILHPNDHSFLVPDIVFTRDQSPREIESLFDSALSLYNVSSLIWFVDPNQDLYRKTKNKIRWGLLDKILGEKKVALVCRNQSSSYEKSRPVFVSAFDII